MLYDRLTGEAVYSPPKTIDIGRYLIDSSNLHLPGGARPGGGVLVSDGADSFQLGSETYSFMLPEGSLKDDIEQFSKLIETLDQDIAQADGLISPLMPAAVIDDQSHLLPFEKKLLEVLNKGHLHQISLRPRLDLYYEDEVTDIARAKRLAKGALVHLASHSECWQRQTLSGVIPKKVLARFSEDDYSIYENRVYARLLDDTERHLQVRIRGLRKLQTTLMDAQEFYKATDRNHRLTAEICTLWGQTFNEAETNSASGILEDTLATLEFLRKTVKSLKQKGLYQRVQRNAHVGNSLHMTNILGHDSHYRHLPVLWDLLRKVKQTIYKTPEERYQRNLSLANAYSRYAGLALRHALKPFMSGLDEGIWAGRILRLKQDGLEWTLTVSSSGRKTPEEVELLKVIPWFGFTQVDPDSWVDRKGSTHSELIVAWPALDEVSNTSALAGNWIALSPFDLYCVERFGSLVDRVLNRYAVKDYGKPIKKVPVKVLELCTKIPAQKLEADLQNHTFIVREKLSDREFADLRGALADGNATEIAIILEHRQQEIASLENCPVCSAKVKLHFQQPDGFRAKCPSCSSERYLRTHGSAHEYEQKLDGLVDFRTTGRRSFSFCWND